MPTGWVRSLHCKSNVSDDVIIQPKPSLSISKLRLPRSCTRSHSQPLKDSIFPFPKPKPTNPKPEPRPKTMPVPPSPPPPLLSASLPSFVELPPDHPTHGVVQRIFLCSWSPDKEGVSFSGEIDRVFRIRHPIKALAQFEQYRAAVKARSAGSDPRCIADGNEMMCFHCPAGGEVKIGLSGYNGSDAPVKGIRTFSGSGGAHESVAQVKDMEKRAMLVCRVIAGRVRDDGIGADSEFESVRVGKEEIVVLDPRSLLPCFLIIYKV
ncbi:zinc finger (C2H2 type) family protein [Rhynchospora pubera]|uniref:Zinc finger (C2H2 type) family protein n=1 Tax=Rhynchospora pubera TaxID=906938 RepID=A0AAV8CVD8_9POAL|nr:zinc finger (C2H2 type) family protein [Rhynchospora pubera]